MYKCNDCPYLIYHSATWEDPEEYICRRDDEPDDCGYAVYVERD
jgi:hypothetical protein